MQLLKQKSSYELPLCFIHYGKQFFFYLSNVQNEFEICGIILRRVLVLCKGAWGGLTHYFYFIFISKNKFP